MPTRPGQSAPYNCAMFAYQATPGRDFLRYYAHFAYFLAKCGTVLIALLCNFFIVVAADRDQKVIVAADRDQKVMGEKDFTLRKDFRAFFGHIFTRQILVAWFHYVFFVAENLHYTISNGAQSKRRQNCDPRVAQE